jgi:uncharacterized protein
MHVTHGPENSAHFVVLAPGDSASLKDPVLTLVAERLAEAGLRVVRFGFPACDTQEAEVRDAVLGDRIREAAAQRCAGQELVLAGISRGARVSTALVEELNACALVGFAYPFHAREDPNPHGREHALAKLSRPALICQGTRDSHGNLQQVRGYHLPENIRLHWLEDANHALYPRKRFEISQKEQLEEALAVTVAFIRALS